MRATNTAGGGLDRRGVESIGNAAGHGANILQRPTLTLKRKPAAMAETLAPYPVPLDAEVSFVNWRRGHKRPTRRYLTAKAAFAEARRLQALEPEAVFFTYRLTLIREVGP